MCNLWLFRGFYANARENFYTRRITEFVCKVFDTPLDLVIRRNTRATEGNVHLRRHIGQNPEQQVQGPLRIPNLKQMHGLSPVCSSSLRNACFTICPSLPSTVIEESQPVVERFLVCRVLAWPIRGQFLEGNGEVHLASWYT